MNKKEVEKIGSIKRECNYCKEIKQLNIVKLDKHSMIGICKDCAKNKGLEIK